MQQQEEKEIKKNLIGDFRIGNIICTRKNGTPWYTVIHQPYRILSIDSTQHWEGKEGAVTLAVRTPFSKNISPVGGWINDIMPIRLKYVRIENLLASSRINKERWFFQLGKTPLCLHRDKDRYVIETLSGNFVREISYLHELQNLYFFLTGEELLINF